MVITELDPGGAERAFARIAKGLKSLSWDVDVVSLRDAGALTADLQNGGIPVTALNCGGVLDLRGIRRLRDHLKSRQPNVVLSFLHQANLFSRIAARSAGITKTVSGIRVADRRRGVTLPDRLTSGLVSKYVAVSRTVAEVHADCCGLKELPIVIPNGVDVEAITAVPTADRSSIACRTEDIIILCVGRLSEQKAPLDALRGFEMMRARCPGELSSRLRLVFVGDGPLDSELRRQISQSNLSSHVVLAGWRADVWGIMKTCNVLLLASHWEGLPNVVMEAQAARLPVVASNIDGNVELVRHGETGRLFDVGNLEQLSQRLLDAIENSDQTRAMAQAAFQEIQSWTWDAAVQAYDQLLTSVLES